MADLDAAEELAYRVIALMRGLAGRPIKEGAEELAHTLRAAIAEAAESRAASAGEGALRQDGCWHGEKGHPCALPEVEALRRALQEIQRHGFHRSPKAAMEALNSICDCATPLDCITTICKIADAAVAPAQREGK